MPHGVSRNLVDSQEGTGTLDHSQGNLVTAHGWLLVCGLADRFMFRVESPLQPPENLPTIRSG